MPDGFDKNLEQNLQPPASTNEDIVKELDEINEKDYLNKIKPKNQKRLIKLDFLERERIAQHIVDLYNENKTWHQEICDRIDLNDEVYRMKRKQTVGADENTPNYRTPLSTVTVEVIHANVMNVFFTPADVMRVIPTEANDIPKIKKLDQRGELGKPIEATAERLQESSIAQGIHDTWMNAKSQGVAGTQGPALLAHDAYGFVGSALGDHRSWIE